MTSRLLSRGLKALLLSLYAAIGHAQDGGDALRSFVEDVRTYHANFRQTQIDERGETLTETRGSLVLARPGRFRWETSEPYVQVMVADGERLWNYEPDLAQATVRPAAEALAGTPAELLAQGGRLDDTFDIREAPSGEGRQTVVLTPKSEQSDFARIELTLADGAPQRMLFIDVLGTRTEVVFTDIEVNAPIDEAQLRFTPPSGTEVIDAGA